MTDHEPLTKDKLVAASLYWEKEVLSALQGLRDEHNQAVLNIKDSSSQYWLGYRDGVKRHLDDISKWFPLLDEESRSLAQSRPQSGLSDGGERPAPHVHVAKQKLEKDCGEFDSPGFGTGIVCSECSVADERTHKWEYYVELLWCEDCQKYYCPECQVKELFSHSQPTGAVDAVLSPQMNAAGFSMEKEQSGGAGELEAQKTGSSSSRKHAPRKGDCIECGDGYRKHHETGDCSCDCHWEVGRT